MESIEVSGKSVDDAVLQALVRLHKSRDEVDVTVLQEPARGTFGLGTKDALIRVTVRPPRSGAVITPEMADALLGPAEEEEELYGEDSDEEFEDEFAEDELADHVRPPCAGSPAARPAERVFPKHATPPTSRTTVPARPSRGCGTRGGPGGPEAVGRNPRAQGDHRQAVQADNIADK